jgi:hypothetical protein
MSQKVEIPAEEIIIEPTSGLDLTGRDLGGIGTSSEIPTTNLLISVGLGLLI